MFCAPGLILAGIEDLGSRWLTLFSQTFFWRYRGRRVLFSCFALPESFRAVPRASGTVFKFCTPGHVFYGTDGVGKGFLVFALPDSFSIVPRVSGLIVRFCAAEIFLGVTEGVGSRFHGLHSWSLFRRYRGRQVLFSCFGLPDSFSTVAMTLGPIGIFCAPGYVFGGNKGAGYRFQVLRSRTHFGLYRGCRGSISCFDVPDTFWAVSRPLGLVFKFCLPGHIFDGTEGVGARCHILRSRTLLGVTEGVGSSFHVLCSRTRFGR
jgi:hypothetical protein